MSKVTSWFKAHWQELVRGVFLAVIVSAGWVWKTSAEYTTRNLEAELRLKTIERVCEENTVAIKTLNLAEPRLQKLEQVSGDTAASLKKICENLEQLRDLINQSRDHEKRIQHLEALVTDHIRDDVTTQKTLERHEVLLQGIQKR